jgi:hypothetical protein
VTTTATEIRPGQGVIRAGATSATTTVRQVSQIYTDFLRELHAAVPRSMMRPLVDNDEDASGADFAFAMEVKQVDFERVVSLTSELEAKYYSEHGVNFIIVPEVM